MSAIFEYFWTVSVTVVNNAVALWDVPLYVVAPMAVCFVFLAFLAALVFVLWLCLYAFRLVASVFYRGGRI